MNTRAKGNVAERKSKRLLQDEGRIVIKAGASLGAADLIALKAGEAPQMVQVKATAAGPYDGFGPVCRGALLSEAHRAGATPVLHWWAPRARNPKILGPGEWPPTPGWP